MRIMDVNKNNNFPIMPKHLMKLEGKQQKKAAEKK